LYAAPSLDLILVPKTTKNFLAFVDKDARTIQFGTTLIQQEELKMLHWLAGRHQSFSCVADKEERSQANSAGQVGLILLFSSAGKQHE